MKKRGDRIIYSPSDLIVFMESEFASWMDRFDLEVPNQFQPDAPDAGMEILAQKGNEHELKYLQQLRDDAVDISEIQLGGNAFADTVAAMKAGRATIYQGELQHANFAGRSDFLRRVAGSSDFGEFQYEVWDTKLSRKAKPYFVIQLCCYAEMLAAVQGVLPDYFGIILGDGQAKKFRTLDYIYYYRQLKQRFLDKQSAFDPDQRPLPNGTDEHRRWTSLAQQILEDMDHLSGVANIRRTQIAKLEKADICTLTDLANSTLTRVAKMEPPTFKALCLQSRLQLESRGLDRPKFVVLPHAPEMRRGLGLLPPQSPLDVFFDMEGYPHVEGGLEYLFGASHYDRSELKFNDWWGHDRSAEKLAFEQFVDWIYARWQCDPGMHVYHYADYEISALRRLMGRHATREREVDALMRNEAFVNLFTVVRQGLCVGTPSYSIKEIEHLYRDKRSTEVATAMDSVVFYQKWLEHQDGIDCTSSETLKKIRDYNRDDCDSTAGLAEWLRAEQEKQGLKWIAPPPQGAKSQAAEARDEAAELAQELLAKLPAGEEDARVQTLLAHLLEFHWRESKPIFWAMYDRRDMTEEQLIEDPNCLGGLKRTGSPPEAQAKSLVFEYRFDPAQDTKIDVGRDCFFSHDITLGCKIVELNDVDGLVKLKIGPTQLKLGNPPAALSLIPKEFIPPDPLVQSIYRTVSAWSATGKLPQAIENILFRRRPVIKGNLSGPILTPGADIAEECIDAAKRLDRTTLCIQGPPGSGKTTTGARIILELMKSGKRVGVTSNSHKAIANLLMELHKAAEKEKYDFSGTKIQSKPEDFGLEETPFVRSKNVSDALGPGAPPFQLIGGTAWAFSDECAIGQLDYLFVDEAGQVSVANLLAMAPSTENIIIMGDQMQLSQPTKGAHPGESGQSILQYLLQDQQTISPDFGVFLGITYRMHPDVCQFISTAVYEGRLHPAEETIRRSITLPPGGARYVTRQSGILYVPVEHEGNTQSSDEETAVIAQIIDELKKCKLNDHGVPTVIAPQDILVVAPYNMQVRSLKSVHHRDYVGTVDKFQGLQAPVVIVSMCSSDGHESSRGIEFLFSKNRLNVAISRAKCLAIIVGSPNLSSTATSQVQHMELVNLYCRIVEEGRPKLAEPATGKI